MRASWTLPPGSRATRSISARTSSSGCSGCANQLRGIEYTPRRVPMRSARAPSGEMRQVGVGGEALAAEGARMPEAGRVQRDAAATALQREHDRLGRETGSGHAPRLARATSPAGASR